MAGYSHIMRLYNIIISWNNLSELLSRPQAITKLPPSTLAGLFSIFVVLILINYTFVIYPIFVYNLKHIPGPYISKITSLWLTYKGYKNNTNQYIHMLHNKYGPVVRVAPSVVSFNSVEAISAIYGVRSKFQKPSSASNMNNYGKPNTFSSVSNEDHRRRRGRYASTYSRSYLTQGRGYDGILGRTKQIMAMIDDAARNRHSVDIYKIFHFYAVDNASVIASGTTMGLLGGKNLGYSQDMRDMFMGLAYVFYLPVISMLMRLMPIVSFYLIPKVVFKAVQAHQRVQEKNFEHYRRSRAIQQPEFKNAVLMRLQEHKDYGSLDLTDMHVASEISDHLLAGADTIVAGLVYTFWELARPNHKAHLERLLEETNSIDYGIDGCQASYTAIDGLVWLECCVREGLRLHTPSGHIQARVVPKGGAMVAGYIIPEQTEVGIPLYSIQLNSSIFEEPHSFKPERWLKENTEPDILQKMRLAWMTFGYGARICVGKELALVQMKLLLAMVLHKFSVTVDDTQNDDEMEAFQMAVLAPKGGRCLLRFSHRKDRVGCSLSQFDLRT